MTKTDKPAGPIRRAWRAFRSSITGRFVTRKFNDEKPDDSVAECRKR